MIDFVKKFLKSVEDDPEAVFTEKLDYEAAYRQTFLELDIKFHNEKHEVYYEFNKRYYVGNGKIEEVEEGRRHVLLFNFCKDMYKAVMGSFFDSVGEDVNDAEVDAFSKKSVVGIIEKLKSDVLQFLDELFKS